MNEGNTLKVRAGGTWGRLHFVLTLILTSAPKKISTNVKIALIGLVIVIITVRLVAAESISYEALIKLLTALLGAG